MRARISVGPSSSSRLSSSRPPRLGRPPGRRARSAPPTLDPATTHKGSGGCEENGGRAGSAFKVPVILAACPFTAARLTGAAAHHHQRGGRRWQVSIVRALLPSTPYGARIDAGDIGQANPCPMDDAFFGLLRRNAAGLAENFRAAGYVNVIAGSVLRRYPGYVSFRQLPRPPAVFLIDLLAGKEVRDHRRITRAKRTTQQWRDMADQIPEDRTIRRAADADYRYTGIDTTGLDVGGTVQRIKDAIPEVYAG